MKKQTSDEAWDFGTPTFDMESYERNQRSYIKRRKSHDCDREGCNSYYGKQSNLHELHEVWDDFKLSYRQREVMGMEILRAKGREVKEGLLLKRFVSTVNGRFVLRLQRVDGLDLEQFGDRFFKDEDQFNSYYNYCIELFGFNKDLLIRPEEEHRGFFESLMSSEEQTESWDFEEVEGWV